MQSLSGAQFATSSVRRAHSVCTSGSVRELRMDFSCKPLHSEVPLGLLFLSLSSISSTTATSAAVIGLRDRLALFSRRPVRRLIVAEKVLKESAA